MVLDTTPLESISREPQHAVHFDNVAVDDGAILGGGEAAIEETSGSRDRTSLRPERGRGATHVLEMTVDYTKQRVQFDRAIATFQSVQHDCADMVMAIDAARLATYEAITRIEDGPARRQRGRSSQGSHQPRLPVDDPDRAADTWRHRLHGRV